VGARAADDGEIAGLDADEAARVARQHSAPARRRFVAARVALRALAAAYLGEPASALRFAVGERGKPCLVAPAGAERLRFNLAHSGDLVLLAFSIEHEVGVDVELTSRPVDWPDIAERHFPPAEVSALRALPPALRRRAFFAAWSCKEALGKALGEGLTAALDVPIPLSSGPTTLPLARPLYLLRLAPGRGYVGALASTARPARLLLLSLG